MNNKDFYLYIDETGIPDLSTQNPYILCGCSILREKREPLAIKANQIKFKYWGHENVHFHSVDIARNNDEFAIFKGQPELKENFINDLLKYLNTAPVFINTIIIDKKIAKKRGWIQRNKIVYETAENLIRNFILMIYAQGNIKGRIIIESSADKDLYYLKAFNYFHSFGIPEFSVSHADVKDCLTSISFVTKKNDDIETQITDLLSYGAKCKFSSKSYKQDSYEYKIKTIFEKKLFYIDPRTSKKKREILKEVRSYLVLPKK